MTTVNMHEAKTQLSKLVSAVVGGETVVIAKAGRPVAKLTRVDSEEKQQRLGFLRGQAVIPDDFDAIGNEQIALMFTSDIG